MFHNQAVGQKLVDVENAAGLGESGSILRDLVGEVPDVRLRARPAIQDVLMVKGRQGAYLRHAR